MNIQKLKIKFFSSIFSINTINQIIFYSNNVIHVWNKFNDKDVNKSSNGREEKKEKTLNTCTIFIISIIRKGEVKKWNRGRRLMEMFVLIFIRQKQYVWKYMFCFSHDVEKKFDGTCWFFKTTFFFHIKIFNSH